MQSIKINETMDITVPETYGERDNTAILHYNYTDDLAAVMQALNVNPNLGSIDAETRMADYLYDRIYHMGAIYAYKRRDGQHFENVPIPQYVVVNLARSTLVTTYTNNDFYNDLSDTITVLQIIAKQ